MLVDVGTRIGAYEITGPLGEGGMGVVYRARDTKLDREVALKVLPSEFASDPERLARFKREAQLIASLNHPNIAAIYGLEESSDIRALVLELVDGPTLADRITQGPIPLDEALSIGRQIADALEAAHEQNIIHRDLKPANVKITSDGKVKVLDFGLAKLLDGPAGPAQAGHYPRGTVEGNVGSVRLQPDLTNSPTITTPAITMAGVILGTAAYMSPEQAKSRPADKRSDIWAFGCVLYEMLSGKRAFEGDDMSDTLATVLKSEPDWGALNSETPLHIRTLLEQCLQKDRTRRLSGISAVTFLLNEPVLAASTSPVALRRRLSSLWLAAAGVLLIIAASAIAWTVASSRREPTRALRVTLVPASAQPLANTLLGREVALSPDGTHLAYIDDDLTGRRLMMRSLDQLEPVLFRGIVDAETPFWSPDGKWLGYYSRTSAELRKVALAAGPPVTICRIPRTVQGAVWGSNHQIVIGTSGPLMTVSDSGGEPKPVMQPDGEREVPHIFPSLLPGDRFVLLTPFAFGSSEATRVDALDLETGRVKTVIQGGSRAQYVDDGYLVYEASGSLFAVRFDIKRLETLGDPIEIADHVGTGRFRVPEFTVSRTGPIAYVVGSGNAAANTGRTLVWVDRTGHEEPIGVPPRAYQYPRLSPDNKYVAVSIADQEQDIWIWDMNGRSLRRLTFDPADDSYPVWTPDGLRILFGSTRTGKMSVFQQRADGSGTVEQLSTDPQLNTPWSISPDGRSAVIGDTIGNAAANDLAILRLGDAPPRAESLIKTMAVHAEISPDGHWLAYMSRDTGRSELYVRPFPNVNDGRWQVSTAAGSRPVWTRNGKELIYYEANSASIVAVPVQITSSTFGFGTAQKLFQWPTVGQAGLARTFDVTADGQRFLMIKEPASSGNQPATSSTSSIVALLNWVGEFKQREKPSTRGIFDR